MPSLPQNIYFLLPAQDEHPGSLTDAQELVSNIGE